MAPTIRQTNFSAGELAPLYWGRTDLAAFARGLRRCRNFFVTKSGAVMSRPGTRVVAQVKEVDEYTNTAGDVLDAAQVETFFARPPVRLVPFVFSDEQSCVLEFGERYVRVHALGATITSGGAPFEVTSYTTSAGVVAVFPYPALEVWNLTFAQTGNIITICCRGLPTVELRRYAPDNWAATETQYSPPAPVLQDIGDSFFPNPFDPVAPDQQLLTTPFVIVANSIGTPDLDHPAREWVHAFTSILQHRETGRVLESVATVVRYSHADGVESYPPTAPTLTALTTQKIPIFPDMPVTLKRLATAAATPGEYRTLGFRIYRGSGDLLGWIGDTRGREFIDVGAEPDYAIQPPLGFNPFDVDTLVRPGAVAFFQNRRVFGGPGSVISTLDTERHGWLFFSAHGDFYNFDPRLALHVAGESLTFELATRRHEMILHLVALERLVALTNSSVWTIGGQAGSPLDFDSVDARQNDDVGASRVTPLVIDGAVLFVRTKGTGARALVPQAADTPYQGINVSELASHLFVGKQKAIVDMAYQEDPFGVVWAVREDGALLSLTFDRARDMAAWALHDTEEGEALFESVCCIPEGEEDAVYVIVNRPVTVFNDATGAIEGTGRRRYIERFTSRVRRVLEDDEPPEVVATPTSSDTDSLYPTDLCLDCAFTYRGSIASLGALPCAITDTRLLALYGKDVYVIARGQPVIGPLRVSAEGVLTLDMAELPEANAVDETGTPVWVAHVGLLFQPELETLDVAGGDARLRQKTIARVGFEVDNSRGLSVGQDFDHVKPWRQRQVSDDFDPISAATALVDTPVSSKWDQAARAVLRQTLPLPVTVVGITRELAVDSPNGAG